MTIADNVKQVRAQIAESAVQAGRRPDEITLVAVSKTFPAEAVAEGYAAGLRDFGENRMQEAESKIGRLAGQLPGARWHLIGHLQRNKTKTAVQYMDVIHSVDSLRLAETLDGRCAAVGKMLPVLLEVNIGEEEAKSGYRLGQGTDMFFREAERIAALPHLRLEGLMTIAPFTARAAEARPTFARLRELRDALAARVGKTLPQLSMGMSGDFPIAIAEGATLVRIGTAIFGERIGKA